jgi:hypothetical protein
VKKTGFKVCLSNFNLQRYNVGGQMLELPPGMGAGAVVLVRDAVRYVSASMKMYVKLTAKSRVEVRSPAQATLAVVPWTAAGAAAGAAGAGAGAGSTAAPRRRRRRRRAWRCRSKRPGA